MPAREPLEPRARNQNRQAPANRRARLAEWQRSRAAATARKPPAGTGALKSEARRARAELQENVSRLERRQEKRRMQRAASERLASGASSGPSGPSGPRRARPRRSSLPAAVVARTPAKGSPPVHAFRVAQSSAFTPTSSVGSRSPASLPPRSPAGSVVSASSAPLRSPAASLRSPLVPSVVQSASPSVAPLRSPLVPSVVQSASPSVALEAVEASPAPSSAAGSSVARSSPSPSPSPSLSPSPSPSPAPADAAQLEPAPADTAQPQPQPQQTEQQPLRVSESQADDDDDTLGFFFPPSQWAACPHDFPCFTARVVPGAAGRRRHPQRGFVQFAVEVVSPDAPAHTVWRRYSEFRRLYLRLVRLAASDGALLIPRPPPRACTLWALSEAQLERRADGLGFFLVQVLSALNVVDAAHEARAAARAFLAAA